jgi:hypothetical protein
MKRIFLLLIITVAVLVGLFFVLKPKAQEVSSNEKTFRLEIKDKKIVSGPTTLSATQGDSVTIKLKSDIAEEFHLHGYDRSVDLVPNSEVELKFVADLSGRFEFELEMAKLELGALEVQPK